MEKNAVLTTADKLSNAQDQLSEQESLVKGLGIKRASLLSTMSAAKQKKEGGYCAAQYSKKSERENCQAQANSAYATALANYNGANVSYGSEAAKISAMKDKVEALEEQLKVELSNSETLASQGLSSTALEAAAITAAQGTAQAEIIKGQAEAGAIRTDSNVRASVVQKAAETTDEAKAGANKLLIAGGAILLLIVAVIVYKKFIAKK